MVSDLRHNLRRSWAEIRTAAGRGGMVGGVVVHSDQGSEYTAGPFRTACRRIGAIQSMGRVGSALDNAAAESLFSSLEFELFRTAGPFATRAEARYAVAAWVDDFNVVRLHSANGMLAPIAYEQAAAHPVMEAA